MCRYKMMGITVAKAARPFRLNLLNRAAFPSKLCTPEFIPLLAVVGTTPTADEQLAVDPPDPNPPTIKPPKLPVGAPSTTVLDPTTRLPPDPSDTEVPPSVVPGAPGDNVTLPTLTADGAAVTT